MNKNDYLKLTKPYFEKALRTLQEFVRIPSVHDANTINKNMPYGKGVHTALIYIGELAKSDGFEVSYCDGHCVEIQHGKGNDDLAIFAHADVVPATGNWDNPPFSGFIKDGYIYSRGVSDDKGAAIASYYALKALKDAGLLKDIPVRLVIGGNEERGSTCMNYYFNTLKKAAPKYGFTPDATFPLIYGEKGITNYESILEIDLSPIISINGGEAANSVIDKTVVTLPKEDKFLNFLRIKKYSFTYEDDGSNYKVIFHGKSAHGSTPEFGFNAGIAALKAIGDYFDNKKIRELAKQYYDVFGANLGEQSKSELLGLTTFNVGLINYENGQLTFVTNFRYHEKVDVNETIKRIENKTKTKVRILSTSKHLLFDPTSDFVKTLLKVYQNETGDKVSKPFTIGGGTYAKECPNTIAFGCSFGDRHGNIHAPNEYLLIEDFNMQIRIYAHAIMALAKLGGFI